MTSTCGSCSCERPATAACGAGPGDADVEALLVRAVHGSTTGITIADATQLDMPLVWVNEAFERLTGHSAAEVLGRNCRLLQAPDADPEVLRALRVALREGREHTTVLRNVRKDGTTWWNELRTSPVHDATGRTTHYFGFQHDVTERVEAQQRAEKLAACDPLTELPNRSSLRAALVEQVAGAAASGTRCAVVFVDLDGFKAVNDRLGHAAGDVVLAAAAAVLRGALRESDVLGRWSGDEFVVLLPQAHPDSARRVAERVAQAVVDSLAEPLAVAGHRVQLGASAGVAVYPEDGGDADALVGAADRAMYAAKAAGRGRTATASAPAGTAPAL